MIDIEQQKKIVARNVRDALRALEAKPQDLADNADLARSTVNRILEAESMPTGRTITKLCEALFCESDDLLPSLEELKAKKENSLHRSKKARAA